MDTKDIDVHAARWAASLVILHAFHSAKVIPYGQLTLEKYAVQSADRLLAALKQPPSESQ